MKHLDLNDLNSLSKRKSPSNDKKAPQNIHSLTHSETPVTDEADKKAIADEKAAHKSSAIAK